MTNIRCKGGKEIDLLAINPTLSKRFHVEARVSTTFPLRLRETKTRDGKSHKNGVDYFAREKFNHPYVVEKIKEFFGEEKYRKILIVSTVHKHNFALDALADNPSVIEQSARLRFGIEVWSIYSLISSLEISANIRGSRDDVLRLLDLVAFRKGKYKKELYRLGWNEVKS